MLEKSERRIFGRCTLLIGGPVAVIVVVLAWGSIPQGPLVITPPPADAEPGRWVHLEGAAKPEEPFSWVHMSQARSTCAQDHPFGASKIVGDEFLGGEESIVPVVRWRQEDARRQQGL